MYFNSRGAGEDFERVIKRNRNKFKTGVVHSFTGTAEEMKRLVKLNLYIGISGCSLKTEESCDMVR